MSAADPQSRSEQRARVAVGERLLLLDVLRDGAVGVQADVAVRVDEPGHDPALGRRASAAATAS